MALTIEKRERDAVRASVAPVIAFLENEIAGVDPEDINVGKLLDMLRELGAEEVDLPSLSGRTIEDERPIERWSKTKKGVT
jgi:hypothetical protein